jgi:hypothetical protein
MAATGTGHSPVATTFSLRLRTAGTTPHLNRAAERFILSNARLLDVDYGASRYVPWSAIDSHRLPLCVYVTPVNVRWW